MSKHIKAEFQVEDLIMTKIDCSVTVNFLSEWQRMYRYYEGHCTFQGCPMSIICGDISVYCEKILGNSANQIIEIVQQWSDEHPQKTRLDDLNEKYPNYRFYENDKCPDIRPSVFGYCGNCLYCRNSKQTLQYCWDEPLNGGATGKAVE